MDNRYSIDFGVNLLPGLQMIQAARNASRADKRSNAYLDMEKQAVKDRASRESAALARQKEQDDFNRGVQAFNAMPELQRRARQSPEQANVNPYGVNFETGTDLTPDMEGPEPSPAAEAARFMVNPKAGQQDAAIPQAEPTPPREPHPDALPYGVEGPSVSPEGQADRFATTDELMDRAQEGVQPLDVMSMAAANAAGTPLEPKKRLFMTYKGQRSEVPEQKDEGTGFGEEYDALYNHLIELGDGSQKSRSEALKYVAGQFKSDELQKSLSGRQQQGFGFKDRDREDKQEFTAGENAKYKLTFAQRKELANIMARAKEAAAGAAPVNPGVAKLVGMKEEGATDEEIYAEAARLKLTQKEVVTPVQNVVRNAAAGERAGQKREALAATNDKGEPIGVWRDANAAKLGTQQIERFHRVEERLSALISHVEKQGDRVLTPAEVQERLSYGAAVVAALRPFNELSNTAAGQKAEELIVGALGAPGHGFLMGANSKILKHLLEEARGQMRANLNTKLRPGGGSQLAPALGGPRGGGQHGGHPSEAPVGETKTIGDKTYRKVGPNNWQLVTQ